MSTKKNGLGDEIYPKKQAVPSTTNYVGSSFYFNRRTVILSSSAVVSQPVLHTGFFFNSSANDML